MAAEPGGGIPSMTTSLERKKPVGSLALNGPLKMKEIMNRCDYCESEECKLIYEYTRFEKNNILQCQNCGLVFLELDKSKKEIEAYYSSGKYQT
mgnify:CR=1 FL=1